MRYSFKLLLAALLILALAAGCARHAPPSGSNAGLPPVSVNASILNGAGNASLQFLNGTMGWAVVSFNSGQTPHSIIINTTDGGTSWYQVNAPGLTTISSCAFVDAVHGWALTEAYTGTSGASYAIMATGDGGKTWAQQWQQQLQLAGGSSRMQFLDAEDGFVLVDKVLLATNNGGTTWVQRGSGGPALDSFSFSDNLTGWGTANSSIWHTKDGGQTWVKQWTVPDNIKSQFGYNAGDISFISPTTGWALFQGSAAMQQTLKLVLFTNDGGSNWAIASAYLPGIQANLNVKQTPPYTAVQFIPLSATGALLAASPPTDYPVLYSSQDSGASWSVLSGGMSAAPGLPKGAWGSLSFINAQEGWSTVIQYGNSTSSLAVLKTMDGGKSWTALFP